MTTMSKTLSMYTIYESPADYPPGTFVVRKWEIRAYGRVPVPMEATAFKTLREARESIPRSHHLRTVRSEHDDPCILETWL